MLRVTTIHANTAGPSARYYTRYLADDGPEEEGVWLGRQATDHGLSGSVKTEDLEALLSGHDPVTGTRLGSALVDRYDGKGRLIPAVAGFDATFSAPKSLSVWWGLTGDPGLLEAHDIAVRAVMDHFESRGATTRIRVNGSRQHPDVNGLVMAAFRQTTSREDDPQLHTHVVISTKVQTADGRWLALDARYLKRKQRALGGLYQSVLRSELTHRYGVAWGAIVNGQAEIAGMPRELLDAFSKRTAQVDSLLATKVNEFRDREGRDPSRWERAALTREAAADSRPTKTHASTSELSSRWRDEATDLGWTPAKVLTAMRGTARQAKSPAPTLDVSAVLDTLSAGGSSWTRADVLQAICDLAPPVSQMSGHDLARAIEQAADRVIEACVTLDPPHAAGPVRTSDGRSLWIAPTEPNLTHERVLAQEERILTFAFEAHDLPATPSVTLDRAGLDVLQAEAAAAVAGRDQLVLVIGPAGTGKTTTLRRAVEDLQAQGRAVFGVAPTAKATKVLRDETRMPTDTVAKLLYEWRAGRPGDEYRLPRDTTVVVDEAGMCGTGALDELVGLAVSQHWRLVLVGDPRQLQAVGRGGMFDELCHTSRVLQLANIHRFRHQWEQRASLLLRAGSSDALDEYLDHGRVTTGTFDDVIADITRRYGDLTARGRSVALVAETNEHVDQLNAAVQGQRRASGLLGDRSVNVAGGEAVSRGDIVVTRRNDRTTRTDRGEPIRNRDRWSVDRVHADGSITVSHLNGYGSTTLTTDYARQHVRLGYAATAHGHQAETVDVSLTVVTEATSHRSLYVGATRGRNENRLFVVTDEADVTGRRVLERVLTNDRADVPAVVQRRNLDHQVPHTRAAEDAVAVARKALNMTRREAEPFRRSLRKAEREVALAERALRVRSNALDAAPIWRRRGFAKPIAHAKAHLEDARNRYDDAERAAVPFVNRVKAAEAILREAERNSTIARIRDRLDHFPVRPQARELDHGRGIEL